MKNLIYVLCIFTAFSLVACGGDSSEKSSNESPEASADDENTATENASSANQEAPKNMEEAMQQATKAMEEAGLGQKTEPINFRELQNHLPEKMAGLERTSKSGQTSGALGMNVSVAEAKYKTSDGKVINISLTDTGGLGMGMMGMAAWSTAVIDKEDDQGSERTSTLDGYKTFEKTRTRDKSCELSVLAEGRYIVSAKCKDCDMELLKSTVKGMDLGDLPKGGTK